jgi:hypothetical protein
MRIKTRANPIKDRISEKVIEIAFLLLTLLIKSNL